MIYLPDIEYIYLGESGVTKIMQGAVQVWPAVPPTPTGFILENSANIAPDDYFILVEPQGLYAVGNSASTISFTGFTGTGTYSYSSLPSGIDLFVYNDGNYLTFSDGACANAYDFSDWDANPVTAWLTYGCPSVSRRSHLAADGTVYTEGNYGNLYLYRTNFSTPRFLSYNDRDYKLYYAYKITFTYV